MSQQQRLLVVLTLLFVTVLASALMLVYSKHQSRKMFVELEQLNYMADNLKTEWGRLQLEQSAWSDHGRIERIARDRLAMVYPDTDEVMFIKP